MIHEITVGYIVMGMAASTALVLRAAYTIARHDHARYW